MKYRNPVLSILIVTFMLLNCNGDSGACDEWLEEKIESLKVEGSPKAEIIQYRYMLQTVYLVDECKDCSDGMQVVYSCTGQQLCTFGGIAGVNTCPDFFDRATDRKIIWPN